MEDEKNKVVLKCASLRAVEKRYAKFGKTIGWLLRISIELHIDSASERV
jgi:hypothetical protein